MDARPFKDRTMHFGLSVMDLVESLPRKTISDILGRQLVRSATSVGANYRAACRAESSNDFIYKLEVVEEEVDESAYWLELIDRRSLGKPSSLKQLRQEADELTAMADATQATPIRNPQSEIHNPQLPGFVV